MNVIVTPSAVGASLPRTGEQRFLMDGVSYEEYVKAGDAFPDRAGLRMTYDGRSLEFMTLSHFHERTKEWIGDLVKMIALEARIPILASGQMTFRHPQAERGAEPDGCFWIAHHSAMRGRRDWEPGRDPPPDLVIEVEISRSALNRMAIWAVMGVPEVWRFDGTNFRVERLQPDRTWQEVPRSVALPVVTTEGLLPFIFRGENEDYLGIIDDLRRWVQEQQKPPKPPKGKGRRRA